VFEEFVVVRGGGDLGTGVALRLWRAGFNVLVLESERPMAVRRTVSFSEAVFEGWHQVEEASAVLVRDRTAARTAIRTGRIPVLVDPSAGSVEALQPEIVVDAILAKRNTGTHAGKGRLVVALGPGFVAGVDVDAVVETNRGPDLGRVIWDGPAAPNTGEPGAISGQTSARVLRSPRQGVLHTRRAIGDIVGADEVVASVEGIPVVAPFSGLVRGLLRDGMAVEEGTKLGDLDPRADPSLCVRVSDKSLAVAGGVMEAILARLHGRLKQP
jgi:xanthine dehydrogenase accessory factor